MEKPSNKETVLEDEAPQSRNSCSGKKKRKAATQQGDSTSLRIARPSCSTTENRVNSKRKLSKARKENQKKKQRKIDLSAQDDTEEFDEISYADFCVLFPNAKFNVEF